jgi:drug/metabolite transporter (DMT)-like permease
MSLWTAIALTVIASTCMNMGLVLQKKAVSAQPGEESTTVAGSQSTSALWCAGLALLVGGYGLFVLATSSRAAPISLLQPIFACGLLVVAWMAVVYLGERFGAAEWLAVALLFVGVVALGMSAERGDAQEVGVRLPYLLAYLTGLGGVALVVGVLLASPARRLKGEVLFGLLAGLLLGVGYLNTKTVTLAVAAGHVGVSLLGAAATGVGLLGGLLTLQLGFRRGRALIVTAVNLVVNQVIVVLGGIICLGESFPEAPLKFSARVAGLGAILVGTLLLARFSASQGRPLAAQTCGR